MIYLSSLALVVKLDLRNKKLLLPSVLCKAGFGSEAKKPAVGRNKKLTKELEKCQQ